MRIAIIIAYFLPKWVGGTEVATFKIAKQLTALGHDVHIVTSLDEGPPHESTENGASVHRVRGADAGFSRTMVFYLCALRALRKINPEIVHIQNIGLGPCGFFVKRVLKKPYVVWSRGYGFLNLKRTKAILKDADAVIALTDDMKKELQRIWPREISVIPNGIHASAFEEISRNAARSQLQIEEAAKVGLFVGRLDPVKGARYLIEAMRYLKQKEPASRLIVVGPGPERQCLERLANDLRLSETVRFVGKIQNEDVPAYMAASDVLILPSLSEGFPMVCLEAMAAGLPIVATNVGGVPLIVEDGLNGFLIEPRDANQIADKVALILGNPDLSYRMSQSNKNKSQLFTWDSVARDLEKVYLQCLKAA